MKKNKQYFPHFQSIRAMLAAILGLGIGLLTPLQTSIAASASPIYQWSTATTLGPKYWSALATSSDGSTMLAGGFGSPTDSQSYLYLSTDHGATWTQTANNEHGSWSKAAISGDGSTLVAVEYSASDYGPGNLYISHDSGVTWTIASALAPSYWSSIAVSSDGSVISAAQGRTTSDGNGLIYTSHDSGVTWTIAPQTAQWYSVALSADGSTIIAAPRYDPDYNPDYLYLSNDSGVTWSPVTTIGTRADAYWSAVTISNDGQTIAAAQNREGTYASGNVYLSYDQGATWSKTDAPTGLYNDINISGNGQIILAAQENDQTGNNPGVAVLSIDGGANWSQVPIAPNQNFLTTTVSRDGSTLGLTTETQDGASGTYGSVYLAKLVPPPAQPVVSAIRAGDTTITGTTSSGATVTAHFAAGITASAIADGSGKFSIVVPQSITLATGDVITLDAVSSAGATSATTSATVQAAEVTPPPQTPPLSSGPGSSTDPTLAATGSSIWSVVIGSLGLIIVGAFLLGSIWQSSRRNKGNVA